MQGIPGYPSTCSFYQAVLKLKRSACLCHLSAGVKGVHHKDLLGVEVLSLGKSLIIRENVPEREAEMQRLDLGICKGRQEREG